MTSSPMPLPASTAMDLAALQRLLEAVCAPWVQAMGLQVRELQPNGLLLGLPLTPALVHGGGVLCGQALMAAADTAMVLAISRQLGGFRPMTTVQLQTSFMRPIPANSGDAAVLASVLRAGKSLVFGEVHVHDAAGRLAAHATTTYALL